MRHLLRFVVIATLAACAFTGPARAAGGNYTFDGGTPSQQAQVRSALSVSSFDWSIVPAQITIHIAPGLAASQATPGEIWLDAGLLDAGSFSWAIVQHEYAHQVDFFLLDEIKRTTLKPLLGGQTWWQTGAGVGHARLTSERFASTLAWSYWPSRKNSLRPQSKKDESAAMAPGNFRALITQLLAPPASSSETAPG